MSKYLWYTWHFVAIFMGCWGEVLYSFTCLCRNHLNGIVVSGIGKSWTCPKMKELSSVTHASSRCNRGLFFDLSICLSDFPSSH